MLFSQEDLSGMIETFSIIVFAHKGTTKEFLFTGVFDSPHLDFDIVNSEVDYSGRKALLTCRTKDICSLKANDKLFLQSSNYRISDIKPDESTLGLSILELKKL